MLISGIPPSDHHLPSFQLISSTTLAQIVIQTRRDLQSIHLTPFHVFCPLILPPPYLSTLNLMTSLYHYSLIYPLDSFASLQIYHTYLKDENLG